MSEGWPSVKLGKVLVTALRAERVNPTKSYRLLGMRLDGHGPFLRETVLGSQSSASTLFCVHEGDFVYSRLFACRGAFGVIGKDLDGCHVSNEFPVYQPVSGKIDVRFLKYWFQLPKIIAQVDADCTGSTPLTRNRYKEKFFESLEIPLPPLGEQQRIVACVEKVIAKLGQVIELRKQIEAARESLVVSHHLRLAGERMKKFGELVQLAEDRVGVSVENSYPQAGLRSYGLGLFKKAATDGADTSYKYFNKLFPGALVLSQVKGWEGAIAVCPQELEGWFVSPEYRTFRCIDKELHPGYLASLARTKWFWGKLAVVTRGAGARRERTKPEYFLELKLPMPDVEKQAHGLLLFKQYDALKHLQAGTLPELNALVPSILDRVFAGKLK